MGANRCWLDCETTGLDAELGHMLEVAVVATDASAPEYRELASQTWVIKPLGWNADEWATRVPRAVLDMHTKSGLWGAVYAGANLADVEKELLKFLAFFGNPAPGREPIAGSSPHFDARFLEAHMPAARRYFNHRTYCASTLRQFARDHGFDLPSGDPAHRALADVRASIETARHVSRLLGQTRP